MFILKKNDIGTIMFAKGQKVESDIDSWHKRFSHVNFPRLRETQTKNIIFDLPEISGRKLEGEESNEREGERQCSSRIG